MNILKSRKLLLEQILTNGLSAFSSMPPSGVKKIYDGDISKYFKINSSNRTYDLFMRCGSQASPHYKRILPLTMDRKTDLKTIKDVIRDYLIPFDSGNDVHTFKDGKDEHKFECDKYYLASPHSINGLFYGFDEVINNRYFLSDTLKVILSLIQTINMEKKQLGILTGNGNNYSFWDAKKLSSDCVYHKKENDLVKQWIDFYKIKYIEDINFSHKGFIIKENFNSYFTLVSNGTEFDLAKKIIQATEIQRDYMNGIKPNINGKQMTLNGIIITSPSARMGQLLNFDKPFLGDVGIVRGVDDAKFSKIPEFEYLKSFFYTRVPLYINQELNPPIHMMLSSFIAPRFQTDFHPYLAESYYLKNNGKTVLNHRFRLLSKSI